MLPLHSGKAPPWLFARMVKLSVELVRVMIEEYGHRTVLQRMSDPHWFQAFGCVLGFDWHSSGLTTTALGALKEGLKGREGELGFFVAGGKGAASRKTPDELVSWGERTGLDGDRLAYLSRITAKVDNTALQDGYQLYHHVFLVTAKGDWAVVQQGMSADAGYARRYHWLGEAVANVVDEPHAAIASAAHASTSPVLNFVAHESASVRSAIVSVVKESNPDALSHDLARLPELWLPAHHHIAAQDVDPKRMARLLPMLHEAAPDDFESLLALQGVGPKSLRALGLMAELLHGTPTSVRDPARYAWAHGGKDGHPFPVDRPTYDESIRFMQATLDRTRLDGEERARALRRLAAMTRDC
jgi:hypothetical protein